MSFEIEHLLQLGSKISYKKKDYILRQGQFSNKVYFVLNGFVRHFVIDKDGNEKTIRLTTENDFFYSSNVSFYLEEPSYINCQVLENTELIYWTSKQLNELRNSNSGFLEFENKQLINFIIEKHKKEISRLTKTAKDRFVEFNKERESYFNRIPHHIIASYLDMTPETLSRLRADIKS